MVESNETLECHVSGGGACEAVGEGRDSGRGGRVGSGEGENGGNSVVGGRGGRRVGGGEEDVDVDR